MLQLLLLAGGIAAAAIFLPGCKDSKEEAPTPPPSNPPPPPEPSSSQELLPQTTPDGYQLSFLSDPLSVQVFKGFQSKGIKPVDFDQGCLQRKVLATGELSFENISTKDRSIHSCEVYGLALKRYRDFPELAAMVTQKPISWSLDDFDSATDDDEKLRNGLKKSIEYLDALLQAKGFQPSSLDYKKRMAFALNYRIGLTQDMMGVADTPPKTSLPREIHSVIRGELDRIKKELETLGMSEYWDHLKTNAFPIWKSDFSQEYSALGAVRAQTAKCTELSKILYSTLEMAGLTASFIEVDPWQSDHWVLQMLRGMEPAYRHVALQVEFGDAGVVLLDPNLVAINPDHKKYLPLTPRQFVALELSNRAMGPTTLGKKGDLQLLEKAIRLDETLDIPYFNRIKLYSDQENNLEKAMADADKAVALNPKNAFAYSARANLFFRQKKYDRSLEDLNKAIELNGLVFDFFNNRGSVQLIKNQPEQAELDFKQALKLDPYRALPQIQKNAATFLASQFFSKSDRLKIQRELKQDPADVSAKIITILWLVEVGHGQVAKEELQSLVKILEKEKSAFSESKPFLQQVGKMLDQKAKKDPRLKLAWMTLLK